MKIVISVADTAHLKTNLPLPSTMMHIYAGDSKDHVVAENVKIGDLLTLVVQIEKQDKFGFSVAECTVRDGLGWSEQRLFNDQGYEIILLFHDIVIFYCSQYFLLLPIDARWMSS